MLPEKRKSSEMLFERTHLSMLQPRSNYECGKRDEMAEKQMHQQDEIITVSPKQCGGMPCIRGLRIRVTDVLDLLASGLSVEEIMLELSDLTEADIRACLRYASQRISHPRLISQL